MGFGFGFGLEGALGRAPGSMALHEDVGEHLQAAVDERMVDRAEGALARLLGVRVRVRVGIRVRVMRGEG